MPSSTTCAARSTSKCARRCSIERHGETGRGRPLECRSGHARPGGRNRPRQRGVDNNLPLVTAQAALAAAESNLVEGLYQYNLSKLALAAPPASSNCSTGSISAGRAQRLLKTIDRPCSTAICNCGA